MLEGKLLVQEVLVRGHHVLLSHQNEQLLLADGLLLRGVAVCHLVKELLLLELLETARVKGIVEVQIVS